jgi:hypothetical protein
MCRAITEAHAVDEVKDIRDKARAIEMYARLAQNTAAEQQAREIRLRAKCGQMTAQLPTAQGARTDLTSEDAPSKLAALRRASISRDQATIWERLAAGHVRAGAGRAQSIDLRHHHEPRPGQVN